MANTIAEINREIMVRAKALGLEVDCGCDGMFGAEVAIIGEAPGERERSMKMPLCGSSGKYLWDSLRKYGLSRQKCYVTNVIKRQLLSVNMVNMKEKIGGGEVSHYTSILLWELAQLPNLKYVVCLGNNALTAITGLHGITNYRGSVFDVQLSTPFGEGETRQRDVKVVVMYNPAHVLREAKAEVMFKFDCFRLNQVIQGEFREHEVTAHINPTFAEALAWIDKMQREKEPVGLDIESSSGETICIGLANNPHEGCCINFRTKDGNRWTVEEEAQLWIRFQQFVSDPEVRLVTQNGMYDSSWTYFLDRLRFGPIWFDTMLAHHTLYPRMPHSLGFLTSQYTTHPFYKDEGKIWKETGDINAEWVYNVKDCCLMLGAQQHMLQELTQQGLADFFFNHVMFLQPHLVDMTVHGVKIDKELKEQISIDMKTQIGLMRNEYFAMVADCTGDPDYRPNPASPKQMAELFFKKLKLVGRGVATDKENRRRMRDHPRTPDDCRNLLLHIDNLATEQKFSSTYADMRVDDDGRIRCEYKQTGVVSAPGRLSSSSTGWGTGTNLQNQPERAHNMFIADEGYEFNYFDLSQAEARVVAYRAVIPEWMEQYASEGVDSHRALASTMFNVPIEDVPYDDRSDEGPFAPNSIRYIAKRCRHALNYRMMPDRLATTLQCSYSVAEYLWHQYHKTNPQIQQWWEWQIKQVQEARRIYNAYGRRWLLQEKFSDDAIEPVIAFYPQSTIGDKVSRIIYQCHTDPDWPVDSARISLNIHDALIALNKRGTGDTVRRIMKKYAMEPLHIEGMDGVTRELIIPCDLKCSEPDEKGIHRWSTLRKVAA